MPFPQILTNFITLGRAGKNKDSCCCCSSVIIFLSLLQMKTIVWNEKVNRQILTIWFGVYNRINVDDRTRYVTLPRTIQSQLCIIDNACLAFLARVGRNTFPCFSALLFTIIVLITTQMFGFGLEIEIKMSKHFTAKLFCTQMMYLKLSTTQRRWCNFNAYENLNKCIQCSDRIRMEIQGTIVNNNDSQSALDGIYLNAVIETFFCVCERLRNGWKRFRIK